MAFLSPSTDTTASDAWRAAGQQVLDVARLPLSALALGIGIHLLAVAPDAITALAARSVPLPALAFVATVTLYLFGAMVLFVGYRIATVTALLGALTLALAAVSHFG